MVQYADRIAYLNHDIEDAVRAGILQPSQLPTEVLQVLGDTKAKRIQTLILDMVEQGAEKIGFSEKVEEQYLALHRFMHQNVYKNPFSQKEEGKVYRLISELYEYFLTNPGRLPSEYTAIREQEGCDRAIGDYIACMSDRYAISKYQKLFVPQQWDII